MLQDNTFPLFSLVKDVEKYGWYQSYRKIIYLFIEALWINECE
jgi:hypothetical protein